MKVGKISESVLKRSVLKQIKSINTNVINGAGVGADCAIFTCGDAFAATSVQTAVMSRPSDIRYLLIKSANNIACSGAAPAMAMLSIILPQQAEETVLSSIMKGADQAAKELQVQIAGGHTEVSDTVTSPVVSVSMTGSLKSGGLLAGGTRPGQDVVISKWIGLEGTARLAGQYRDRLLQRYPLHMIEKAAAFDRYLSIIPEAATAIKSNVSAMHDVSTGGIFAALWELAESADVGLAIDLKKIPVKQETIEVCEFFGISPYEMLSGGCLLMTADNGDHLVQALEDVDIPAAVVGKTTDSHDRIIINEEERRFLERPKTDAILQIGFPAEL